MTELAHKLHISRTTFYRRLKQANLPLDFVSAMSRSIDHPFLPQLLQTGEVMPRLSATKGSDIVKKYIAALERQLELLQMSTNMLIKEVEKCKKKE